MVRNSTLRLLFGLSHLQTYSTFAAIVWKDAADFMDSFLQSLLLAKRFSGTSNGLVVEPVLNGAEDQGSKPRHVL